MNWDIDKALRFLSSASRPFFRLGNETVNVNRLSSIGLHPTEADLKKGCVDVWFLTFGREDTLLKTFWGRTVHDACLRARKSLRKTKPEDLAAMEVKLRPRKTGRFLRGNFKKGVQADA